jgi:hypothetical protein
MRKVLSAVATAVILTVPGIQAQAAPSHPSSAGAARPSSGIQASELGKLSVSPTTLVPGGKVTVSGSGCPGAAAVSIFPDTRDFSDDRKIASMPTREDGSFNGASRIPSEIGLGTHTISAVCADELIGSARIRLVLQGFVALDGTPGTLTVSRSAVLAGGKVRIFAQPCGIGAAGAALNGTRVKLGAPTLVGAAFRADVMIPRSTAPGMYTLSTRCNGRSAGAATLRVLPAGGSLPGRIDSIPIQRTNVLLGVAAGLILILVSGIGLMSFKRHRTRTATPGYFDLPSSQRPVR